MANRYTSPLNPFLALGVIAVLRSEIRMVEEALDGIVPDPMEPLTRGEVQDLLLAIDVLKETADELRRVTNRTVRHMKKIEDQQLAKEGGDTLSRILNTGYKEG